MEPQVIGGRYEVTRALGRGGMGAVWLCRDTRLGREVAVKQVGALPGDPAAAERASREARIAASLNHPGAVGVYDLVEDGGSHWLVMEYVDGQTLAQVIDEEGSVPANRVASIGATVASALARAHERGIVHRDIKPANVLIDRGGHPKISDFGIARAQADGQLTQTGFVTGTPGYLSPELARGEDPTPSSDVWALGATLYYALEGQPPFESKANPLATLQDIASGSPRPMERTGPVAGAIASMMHPDPTRRWDMATAADSLARVSRGDTIIPLAGGVGGAGGAATEVFAKPADRTQRLEPVAAPTAGAAAYGGPTDPATSEPAEPHRTRAWVLLAVVLAILALTAAIYWSTRPAGTSSADPGAVQPTSSQPQTTDDQPSSPTTTEQDSTTTTTSSTSSTTTESDRREDQRLERFVKDYYADVTKADQRDQTWAQLTPVMQDASGGREGYEQFWKGIDKVEVGSVDANAASGEVRIELVFRQGGGGGDDDDNGRETAAENHLIKVVRDGGSWLIHSDTPA